LNKIVFGLTSWHLQTCGAEFGASDKFVQGEEKPFPVGRMMIRTSMMIDRCLKIYSIFRRRSQNKNSPFLGVKTIVATTSRLEK